MLQGSARLGVPHPAERPGGVRTHQRLRLFPEDAGEGWNGLGSCQIAEGHADVAQEPPPLGPKDGCAREPYPEFRLGEGQQREQFRRVVAFPGEEGALARHADAGVVRADILADIAAEDVVPHAGPQFAGDGSFPLDREVRDAFAGVEDVGSDEGVGRTGIQAEAALPAAVSDRRVPVQEEVQEEIRAGQRVEEFALEVWDGNAWRLFAQGTTIGTKRLLRFPEVRADRVRLTILKSRTNPTLAAFGLYKSPS